jgi:hypothetical protein
MDEFVSQETHSPDCFHLRYAQYVKWLDILMRMKTVTPLERHVLENEWEQANGWKWGGHGVSSHCDCGWELFYKKWRNQYTHESYCPRFALD